MSELEQLTGLVKDIDDDIGVRVWVQLHESTGTTTTISEPYDTSTTQEERATQIRQIAEQKAFWQFVAEIGGLRNPGGRQPIVGQNWVNTKGFIAVLSNSELHHVGVWPNPKWVLFWNAPKKNQER